MVIILLLYMLGLNIKPASGRIIKVPSEYLKIQKAIDAANPAGGDTIQVAAGTYPEHIVVYKPVILQGDNRKSIISGDGIVARIVTINVSDVKITGFTIKDTSGTGSWKGILIDIWPGPLTNITITDNSILDTQEGIHLSYCNNCLVSNNTIDYAYYGIRAHDSSGNAITSNIINRSRYYGINLYSYDQNNRITSNQIINGQYGVLLEYSSGNSLKYNTIASNTEYGIRLSYSNNTLIRGNNIMKNKYGVYLWSCGQNTFYYNNFIENTNQVIHYQTAFTANTWDDSKYPPAIPGCMGNYWSDYTGKDDGSGVGRFGEPKRPGDKIGDTLTPHLSVDWYPLMVPWSPFPRVEPVAIFTVDPPQPVQKLVATFNASKSYDPDGNITSYNWNFGDGTPNATGMITTHIFLLPGDYTVNLTVTDNNGLTNSTSKLIQVLPAILKIDVYTQQPDPYSGKGPNQPSDAFAPQQTVILYAQVTYNYEPVENKDVTFVVNDTIDHWFLIGTDFTDQYGIATIDFLLPTNPVFGTWFVLATVSVSESKANDTLTFQVGWLIELLEIETADQFGNPKGYFAKNEYVYFNVVIKNIAFTTKSTNLTVSITDETGQSIAVAGLGLEVVSGTHKFTLIFCVEIPRWSCVGGANAYANALRQSHDPYCPEIFAAFYLTAG
jgi:parallel beta-helix repeat protein